MAALTRRAPRFSAPRARQPPTLPPQLALLAALALLALGTAGAALLLPRGALTAQANARVVHGPATLAGRSAGSSSTKTRMAAVMEPPTRIAPPPVSDDAAVKKSEWAECLVKYTPDDADAQEVWVFRKKDYNEFQRLIGLRLSYNSENSGPMKFGEERRKEATRDTTVTCRERSVDPGLSCAECVRVFTGAAYRDKAISVPAHPAQPSVTGCLALSVGASSGVRAKGYPVPLRETAFCNTVNVRF